MKIIDWILILVVILFVFGIVLAFLAPNPITIGCAIFNGVGLGVCTALAKV